MNRDKGIRHAAAVRDVRLDDKLPVEPTIDRSSQNRIGDHLRAMYDGLMQQPVPDRFVDLIDRLERQGDEGGPGTR